MKILIANDQHWPMVSGPANAVRTLARALANAGNEVLVVAPSQTGRRYKEVDGNYSIVRTFSVKVPFRDNYRLSVTWYREIKKIIEEFSPDIIHIQTQAPVGLTTLKAGAKLGIPIIAANHAMPENVILHFKSLKPLSRPIKYLLTKYGLKLYRDADFINMPTQSAVNLFDNGSVDIPMRAVSNGIDLSRFKPGKVSDAIKKKYGLPLDDTPIVTFVGRLDGEKHIHIMIKALDIVLKKMSVHGLIIGGGAVEEDLHELTGKLKLNDKITFTSRISDEDLQVLHRATDIFVMPSPAELQCLSLLESMACGKAVVAVNVSALPELCQDGRNGYLTAQDDPEEMAKHIMVLAKDKALRKRMGKESLKIASQHNIKNVIKDFLSIYKEVIAISRLADKKKRFRLFSRR